MKHLRPVQRQELERRRALRRDRMAQAALVLILTVIVVAVVALARVLSQEV